MTGELAAYQQVGQALGINPGQETPDELVGVRLLATQLMEASQAPGYPGGPIDAAEAVRRAQATLQGMETLARADFERRAKIIVGQADAALQIVSADIQSRGARAQAEYGVDANAQNLENNQAANLRWSALVGENFVNSLSGWFSSFSPGMRSGPLGQVINMIARLVGFEQDVFAWADSYNPQARATTPEDISPERLGARDMEFRDILRGDETVNGVVDGYLAGQESQRYGPTGGVITPAPASGARVGSPAPPPVPLPQGGLFRESRYSPTGASGATFQTTSFSVDDSPIRSVVDLGSAWQNVTAERLATVTWGQIFQDAAQAEVVREAVAIAAQERDGSRRGEVTGDELFAAFTMAGVTREQAEKVIEDLEAAGADRVRWNGSVLAPAGVPAQPAPMYT